MAPRPDQPESSPQAPSDRPIRRWWQRDMSWDPFCTKEIRSDLKGKSVRGGMWTMGTQGILFVLNLARIMILSRLLTKADFGLAALVMVVVSFIHMFKEAGLGMATVQRDKITHEQVSGLFWVNMGLSAVLTILVAACAPLLAWFYGKPELQGLTLAMSLSVLLSGVGIQHIALLRRQMQFGKIAVAQISTRLANLLVAASLAWVGFGAWALVWGTVVMSGVMSVSLFILCPWVPSGPTRGSGIRKLLLFGGHLTGGSFADFFSRNLDKVLLGKYWGDAATGLYSNAYRVIVTPLGNIRGPIMAVATPALSALQNEPERFDRYAGKIIFMLSLLTMPIMAFCAMFSHDMVLLIFGPEWLAMVPIFRVLAIVGFFQPVTSIRNSLLTASGKSKIVMIMSLATAIANCIGISIGVIWGPMGTALGYACGNIPVEIVTILITCRLTHLKLNTLLRNAGWFILLSWLACLAAMWIVHQTSLESGVLRLALGFACAVVCYLVSCLLIPPIRKALLNQGLGALRRTQKSDSAARTD